MEAGQILVNGAAQATSIWSPITSHVSQATYVQAYQSQAPIPNSDYLNNNNLSSAPAPQSCIVSTGTRRHSQSTTVKNGRVNVDDPVSSEEQASPTEEKPKIRWNRSESTNRSANCTPNAVVGTGTEETPGVNQEQASPLSGDSNQSGEPNGFDEQLVNESERHRFDHQRSLVQQDDHGQPMYDDRSLAQPRSTVIDYGNHPHHELPSHEQLLASGGNILFDLKNSDVFGHQPLQNAFPYPGSGDYFQSTAVANLASLQGMAAASQGQGIHSIFEYNPAAVATVMYQQGHQQVPYDTQVAYYQGAYPDQKLITSQYGTGAWPDATRPLTIQQYAGNVGTGAAGYYPPTPPITSPGGHQAYGRFAMETGALRNWGALQPSDSAAFLGAAYQQSSVGGPGDPLPHLEFANAQPVASPSATSPKECVQCATYESPVWRRQDSGHYLCQNCAFGTANLVGQPMDGESAMVNAQRGQANKMQQAKKAANISKRTGLVCANCRTTNTTLWRRNNDGDPVCNACGLYYKLHHIARPITMRKEGIQTRKRKPKTGGGGHSHQGEKAAGVYENGSKYKLDVGRESMDELKMPAVETRTITTNPYSVFTKSTTPPLDSASSFTGAPDQHHPPDQHQIYGGLLAPFPSVIASHVNFHHDQHRQHEMINGAGGGFRVELPVITQHPPSAHIQQSFSQGHNQFFMTQSTDQQWTTSNFPAFYANSPHQPSTATLAAAPLTPPEQISPSQMLIRHDQEENAGEAHHHYTHSVSNLLQSGTPMDESRPSEGAINGRQVTLIVQSGQTGSINRDRSGEESDEDGSEGDEDEGDESEEARQGS